MTKLAVMQPYFFPYLGYFQLVHAVDDFVFLDDVTFIKGGYINRNSLLLDGKPHRFAVPVRDISSFRRINDHVYLDSCGKFVDLVRHAYGQAPFFQPVFSLVREVLEAANRSVAAVNAETVTACFRYLGLERSFATSSRMDPEPTRMGADRVIHLCQLCGATTYINAAGGRALYEPAQFARQGIQLGFIESKFRPYRQKSQGFVPGLSMIDVLMWNSPQAVIELLQDYSVDDRPSAFD